MIGEILRKLPALYRRGSGVTVQPKGGKTTTLTPMGTGSQETKRLGESSQSRRTLLQKSEHSTPMIPRRSGGRLRCGRSWVRAPPRESDCMSTPSQACKCRDWMNVSCSKHTEVTYGPCIVDWIDVKSISTLNKRLKVAGRCRDWMGST